MAGYPTWGTVPSTQPTTQAFHSMHLSNPAYTQVQTPRMTFHAQPPPMPIYSNGLPPPPGLTQQPVVTKKKVDWPQSVRDYVQRSFVDAKALPGVTKADIETKLKEVISSATDRNALLSTDWATLPLPQVMIQAERAAWHEASLAAFIGNSTGPSQKRKSAEMSAADSPPWRSNSSAPLQDRMTAPNAKRAKNALSQDAPLPKSSKFSKQQQQQDKRQRKADGGYVSNYQSPPPEFGNGPVVGRCEVLEKRYLRLTSAPNPDLVRPPHILKQTLELLKKKWRKESNYSYVCDQFKSLRQDLTVQHIKDKFTVEVYEIHARIALEKGDLGEYNQCQTQLRALYAQNLGGSPIEFKAYRILYFIHTANRTSLNDVLADLTTAEKEAEAIKHALNVRSALALGNYHKFFRLYLDTPNMGAYLMDMFVVRERLAALANICKAYKPAVPLRFITEELGFESDQDSATFIVEHNGQELLTEKGDAIEFAAGKGAQLFEAARQQAFKKIDIGGQRT